MGQYVKVQFDKQKWLCQLKDCLITVCIGTMEKGALQHALDLFKQKHHVAIAVHRLIRTL